MSSRCSAPGHSRFAPAELATQQQPDDLRTVFRVEGDWSLAQVHVTQQGGSAFLTVLGDGDLDQAAAQACRFLSLDIDGRGWPDVARLDPVIADAQRRLPGLRPCGFYSPYEAAAWAVSSQRLRIVQAARLRNELVRRHGHDGAFPAPDLLRILDLDLPGRKTEYLHAVADAAVLYATSVLGLSLAELSDLRGEPVPRLRRQRRSAIAQLVA